MFTLRFFAHAVPCALSAFLLWAAFPPAGETCAVAFAVAPMLALSRLCSPKRSAWTWFACGMMFWTATLSWMPAIVKNNGPLPLVLLGWFGLAALCAGYFALFGWLHARTWRKVRAAGSGWWAVAAIVVAEPVLWAGVEWLRGWLFTGFAWNFLGTAVGAVPRLAAPARLGGVYLVSALVVLVNGVFATLVCRMITQMRAREEGAWSAWGMPEGRSGRMMRSLETALPLAVALAFHIVAAVAPDDCEAAPIRVVLVQRNAPCVFARRDVAENPYEAFGRLLSTSRAMRPDLVVWAESAMAEFGVRLSDDSARDVARHFAELTGGAALMSGGDWCRLPENGGALRVQNAAALFSGPATNILVQTYGKQHLVPFGEYIPFDKWITPLQRFSPIGVSLWPGEARVLRLERDDGRVFMVAPLICFEDTDPVLSRRAARLGAQAIVLMTNDSWFSHSTEPVQHAAQAVLRAIETGLPVMRVGNSGVTGVISPSGRARWLEDGEGRAVVDAAAVMCEAVQVPVRPRVTPYVLLGDWPLAVLFALCLAFVFAVKVGGVGFRRLVLAVLVCLWSASSSAGASADDESASPFARSLVSRMLDARDGPAAPKKRMWYARTKAPDAAQWPFDVARVEGLLEKAVVCTAGGPYRMRRQMGETDARRAGAAALAYVNKVVCEWAVMSLDAKFSRCDAETTKALGAYRADLDRDFWANYAILTKSGAFGGGSYRAGGWITAWKIETNLYLVLTADLAKECRPRDYQFVMWDGAKDWPVAGFDSFPDVARFAMVKSLLLDPASANNLAALLHSREVNRLTYMREYAESLLRRAAAGGCDEAYHNLGVLMEERGLLSEAEAFYSRERAGALKGRAD